MNYYLNLAGRLFGFIHFCMMLVIVVIIGILLQTIIFLLLLCRRDEFAQFASQGWSVVCVVLLGDT